MQQEVDEHAVIIAEKDLTQLLDLLDERSVFLIRQNAVFLKLSQSPALAKGDLDGFFEEVCKSASEILQCDRVGIFLLTETGTAIQIRKIYHAKEDRFGDAGSFVFQSSPAYLNALKENRVIEVLHAEKNPVTRDNQSRAGINQGPRSCLDANIRMQGKVTGGISIIEQGRNHSWTDLEKIFVASLADTLSMALEGHARRLVSEELKESERSKKAILEAMPDMMFLLDSRGNYLDYHLKSDSEIITDRNKLIGANIFDVLPIDIASSIKVKIDETLSTGGIHLHEYELEKREGLRVFEARIVPSGTGRVVMIERDITDKRKAEAELIRRNNELDSFVYKASHDLKAPLNSIMGLIEILQMEADADLMQYISMMDRSVTKLNAFIRNLNDFARIARAEEQFDKIGLRHLVESIFESMAYIQESEKVLKTTDIPEDLKIYTDPLHFEIILSNLISNAVKYHDRKKNDPQIHVTIERKVDKFEITVRDNGIGIPEEHQKKIFDLFFRASHQSFGSGLGLYLTKNAVDRLQGRLRCESNLGEGTVFYLTLPVLEEKENI